jgi:hypothetical protein
MKVCLISFDHWEYDNHIIKALQNKDIEAHHINTGKFRYKYPTPLHRVSNFLNKLILKKNIKKIKQRQYILDELKKIGPQDKILVINPELIPLDIHKKIKACTGEYIAYLYDSSKRYPIDHLLNGLFDKIFSFDAEDVAKYGFTPINNYIYLDKKPIKPAGSFDYQVFMILTIDDRLPTLNKIADELDKLNISYKFILVGKRKPAGLNPNITYQKNIIKLAELEVYLDRTEMFLDIIRKDQLGLSFRVFESLAYQKKLITTNAVVKEYAFYNGNNMMVIDPDTIIIDPAFFTTPYKPLSEDVYNEYTLDTWVTTVFGLDNK